MIARVNLAAGNDRVVGVGGADADAARLRRAANEDEHRQRRHVAGASLGGLVIGWLVAERGVGDEKGILVVGNEERCVRRHARQQGAVGVRDTDNDRIGNDVLLRRRVESDLTDRPGECSPGEGIDREANRLADADLGDVGLGDRRFDLHRGQVARNSEQRRRAERRRDGLAKIDLAADDDPRHRRVNDRIAEVGAILLDLRARGGDLRGGARGGLLRRLVILAADVILLEQLGRAGGVGAGQCQRRRDVGKGRFTRCQPRRIDRGVELAQDLPDRHPAVIIDVQLRDRPRHLSADADDADGVDDAVGGDGFTQCAGADDLCRVRGSRVGTMGRLPAEPRGGEEPEDEQDDPAAACHRRFLSAVTAVPSCYRQRRRSGRPRERAGPAHPELRSRR